MMKSIALNDYSPADDEGEFVFVESPQSFASILMETDDGEESSYVVLPTLQDNLFEARPSVGQEVLPPAIPSSPSSWLSDYPDEENEVAAAITRTTTASVNADNEASANNHLLVSRLDSDVQDLCALLAPNTSLGKPVTTVVHTEAKDISPAKEELPDSSSVQANESAAAFDSLSVHEEEDDDGEDSTTPASSMGGAASTDESGDDDVISTTSDVKADQYYAGHDVRVGSNHRVSKKKRRKQLRLAKKAAAAAAAAAALGHLTIRTGTAAPKRKHKNRKKVANIAVSCAIQSLADYKDEVERTKATKKIH